MERVCGCEGPHTALCGVLDDLPRGSPGPYDGYLGRREGGWEVSALGVVIGVYAEEEVARAVLAEHSAGWPSWRVDSDGKVVRLG